MLRDASGSVLEVCLCLVPPYKRARKCFFDKCGRWSDAKASLIKLECFRLFTNQVLEGFQAIFRCLPVPQCGFTRRIWRRPSSECHLNPSDVYSTLFHVSQMSWKDVSLRFGDRESHSGVSVGGMIQLKSAPSWCVNISFMILDAHRITRLFYLLSQLLSKHGYCRYEQVFCFHYSSEPFHLPVFFFYGFVFWCPIYSFNTGRGKYEQDGAT